MKRRTILKGTAAGIAALIAGCMPAGTRRAGQPVFAHGVASGDPLSDRVVLWTRVGGVSDSIDVRWEVAADPDFGDVLASGEAVTGQSRDYTVKVDAAGLPSGSALYYRFEAEGVRSPTGRTKTTPEGFVDAARLAVASCSNYAYGYFHVYRDIAEDDELDAVLHLGDYIYEHAPGQYATEYAEALDRVPFPPKEIVSVDDYRQRYAQYRSDPDLQAAHARHPFIPIWDDHEFTNDAWKDGAQNHQPEEEGNWPARRDAAIKAWLEWMPVRVAAAGANTQIFRSFRFGDLLSLIMLDTRLHGRDRQPDAGGADAEAIAAALRDPSRRLLGDIQERWLAEQLDRSAGTRWQAIGQQVMVLPTVAPDLEPLVDPDAPSLLPKEAVEGYVQASKGKPPMILDTWNGYPHAREDFLRMLAKRASNPVVLSGDLHTGLAGELTPSGLDAPVAAEFLAPAVTSPGFSEYLPERYPGAFRDGAMAVNPNVKYMDTARKGWLKMHFSPLECRGEWHLVDGVHEPAYTKTIGQSLAVAAGRIRDGLYEPG